MKPIYISIKCNRCSREFVLLVEQQERFKGELRCPYCSSSKLHTEKATDNLKECMGERVYKRVKGALREVR